ncbi:hypothetical protein HXA34_17125 [Salipaludibacillus agaradhaerens]|uniref:hypothetical protein n=1 Tax=Salipaludibacillus agaradhaerens TaxID=76935 RepID=UPI00215090FF|nr:hypothetical protein [Salipaludibacillus agaradhaerens]MCR6108017.1 hypothetical protein [Salipaludibacillus agaradhaerens]MCR6120043.1 hypothetical protein [Salipaludibacillus agaradhaerens]
MKFSYKIIIAVVLLLVVGAFLYVNGWFSGSKDTHPPCDQLPNIAKANEALDENKDLAKKLKELDEGITVEVGTPCSDDQNRGLIIVTYDSKEERNSIDDLLRSSNGFGVPVYLVKR